MENSVTESSQESMDKTDNGPTFKPEDKNGGVKRLSSFKQGSNIRQQRTSIRRGKLDNNPVFENVQITPLPAVRTDTGSNSGYAEIWSHRKNSRNNNIEADDAQKQVKSPHYMEIETISTGKTFKKAEDSHYIDVDLK